MPQMVKDKLRPSYIEYSSITKRNEPSSHEATRRKLKYCSVKRASLKRLRTVWFPVYDIWKRQSFGESENTSGLRGVGRGGGISRAQGILEQ